MKESFALKFDNKKTSILDQSKLPMREEWVDIKSISDMIEAIQSLRIRGAPLIGVAASLSLGQSFLKNKNLSQWLEEAEEVRASRPTAVNLMWAVDRLKKVAEESKDPHKVWDEAQAIFDEDLSLCANIAKAGVELIPDNARVLTHCNTGSLATAGEGTALGIIKEAHRQGKKLHVFVDETRPLLQGGRLTTYELEKAGIPYSLICDSMAGFFMSRSEIDCVLVGADRIAANGDFANKIGTYSLAVLANYHKVKFYVAAPFSTVDLACDSGQQIPIEERKADEVRGFGEIKWAPRDSAVRNPAFDITPSNLVDALVLDSGVYHRDDFTSGKFKTSLSGFFKEKK